LIGEEKRGEFEWRKKRGISAHKNAPGGAKGDIGGSQVTRRELGEASWAEGRD